MQKPETEALARPAIFSIEPRSWKAFLVAVGCTVVAWGVRWAIGYVGPGVSPFPVFLASTLLAAAWAGIPAGAFAAALGFLVSWLVFSLASPGTFSPAGIGLYAFSAIAIISVAERYRTLVRRLESKETAFRRQLSLIQEENDALMVAWRSRLRDRPRRPKALIAIQCAGWREFRNGSTSKKYFFESPNGRKI
jgi:hypothetical protein